MSGGGHQQHQGAPSLASIMPSGLRPDPLQGLTGSSPMAGNPPPQINQDTVDKIKSMIWMDDNHFTPASEGRLGKSLAIDTKPPAGISKDTTQQLPDFSNIRRPQTENTPISVGNVAAGAGQNGMSQGLMAGLGAGDAAANAARASGASLPGATSAEAVAGIQGGLSEMMRKAIQQKLEMLKMAAGG